MSTTLRHVQISRCVYKGIYRRESHLNPSAGHQCRRTSSNLSRDWIEQKEEGQDCSLCLSWDICLPALRHWYSCFLGLWNWHWLPWFLGLQVGSGTTPLPLLGLLSLQLADHGISWPPQLCELMFHNKCLYIYPSLSIYPIDSLFLENPD